VPEIDEAFALNDQDFQAKYRFVKPKSDSTNVVTACLAGKRAAAAADKLREKFGYKNIMYAMPCMYPFRVAITQFHFMISGFILEASATGGTKVVQLLKNELHASFTKYLK
jgi:hypothetical protein